ncbi:MAG: hypothetical protein QMD09_11475, partial [Desulfatibacillaceae bacterium]|nr:hypothetical protein [Desulfatibacillaceae bacterium]
GLRYFQKGRLKKAAPFFMPDPKNFPLQAQAGWMVLVLNAQGSPDKQLLFSCFSCLLWFK